MGNYTSKLFSHHNEPEVKFKTQNHGAPRSLEKVKICTPPMTKRKLTTDPRSATMGITRTPIEVTCTPLRLTQRVASAVPKYLQGKRYLETDFDAVMPVTTPEKFLPDPRSPNISQQRTPIIVKSIANYLSPVVTVNQIPDMDTPVGVRTIFSGLDPRSPAIDFDRTPILKPRSTERAATSTEEIVNATTDGNGRLSYCETTTDYSIPEIQAIFENAPATDESLSLENRLDVCEKVENSVSSGNTSTEDSSRSDCSENEEQITVIRNPKVLSPYSDAISTWIEEKLCTEDNNAAETTDEFHESMGQTLDSNISEIINAVIRNTMDEQKTISNNDKIKVWRDSVSPGINDETKNNAHRNNEEIIIEFDDETTTKSMKILSGPKATSKVEDDRTKNSTKKRKPQQLKDENKPVPDERKIFNAEGKNPIDVNRTPLGNRSNNHKQRQLVTAKSPQQLFRNKGLTARTIQQENTPPTERFISKTKLNGIQWDPDTTVII